MRKFFSRLLNSFRTVRWGDVLLVSLFCFNSLCLGFGLCASLVIDYFCLSDVDMQQFFNALKGMAV